MPAGERPLPPLLPGVEAETRVETVPARRGRLSLVGMTIARADPFGLFRGFVRVAAPQSVLVLPRRYPVPDLDLPGNRRYQHGGVALAASVGDSEEFASLRDYRPGDPLRRIHWRSWARVARPIVKEFQDEFFVRHALVLDTFAGGDAGAAEIFEELAHADRMLEVLAGVEPCAGRPFRVLRDSVLQRQGELSGAICVLLDWDDERRALVHALRARGVPTLTLLVTRAGEQDAETETAADAALAPHRLVAGRIAEGLARL